MFGARGALIIDWFDAVPLGQLADRIIAFLREPTGMKAFDVPGLAISIVAGDKLI
jgi:hypothetical protein